MDQEQRFAISKALMGNQNALRTSKPTSSWRFTVPGQPIPKGRPRHTAGGHTYTPQRTTDAEHMVAVAFRQQVVGFGLPRTGDFRLSCTFHVKRDDADIDNLLKLVMDGLQGVVWVNDKQVRQLGSCAIVIDRADPRTEVTIELLGGDE